MGAVPGDQLELPGAPRQRKTAAVNALKMSVQATLASTGLGLVSLAVPTWASLQALLAGDLVSQGSWLRYWLVFAIAELLTLPIPYMKVSVAFSFAMILPPPSSSASTSPSLPSSSGVSCHLRTMEAKSYLDSFSS